MESHEMNVAHPQVTKRPLLHTIWLSILSIIVLMICGAHFFQTLPGVGYELSLDWTATAWHIRSSRDGPFVVTHLFKPSDAQSARIVAPLPKPMAIIDSWGYVFSPSEVADLAWVGTHGEGASPPKAGATLHAFYYIPKQTRLGTLEKQ